MKLLPSPTRYLFFTGKGGVGKTSLSTATAIQLADAGARVLLVSTDAASNLDEMLGVPLSNAATPVHPARQERRMLHAVGDGTFIIDGRKVDRRAMMAAKLPPGI